MIFSDKDINSQLSKSFHGIDSTCDENNLNTLKEDFITLYNQELSDADKAFVRTKQKLINSIQALGSE